MTQKEQFKPVIEAIVTKLSRSNPQWQCTVNDFSIESKAVFNVVIEEISSGKKFTEGFSRSEINTYLKLHEESLIESMALTLLGMAQKEFSKY